MRKQLRARNVTDDHNKSQFGLKCGPHCQGNVSPLSPLKKR